MTSSQIKKFIGYPLFYIGASMFMYFLLTAGIYPYIDKGAEQFAEAGLLNGIYLNVLYALLCLLITVIAQFFLIGKAHDNELRLSSIFSLAYFGVLFCAMIALIIYASIHSAILIILMALVPLVVCIGEIVLWVFSLLRALKESKEQPQEGRK